MLGGRGFSPPVEDDVQTADTLYQVSVFFRLAFKSGCIVHFLTEESVCEGSCQPEVVFGFL